MQTIAAPRAELKYEPSLKAASRQGTPPLQWRARLPQTDFWFVELLNAYRPSGGLARRSEVLCRAKRNPLPPVYSINSANGLSKAIQFEWQGQTWLPLFQFDLATQEVLAHVEQIVCELDPVLGSWDLADWFVQPHVALRCLRPIDVFRHSPGLLLAAARQDRFTMTG